MDTARSVFIAPSVYCSACNAYSFAPRPDAHQPVKSGPPCAYPSGNQAVLYRVPPRPQHSTGDSRTNTVGSLLAGFGLPANPTPLGPAHDLQQFDPNHASAALTDGVTVPNRVVPFRTGRHGQQNQQQAGGPGVMLNGDNSCFWAATFTFLCGLEMDLNLDAAAVRDLMHQALEALFVQQAADLRNQAVAPFSPLQLQQAYNQCVAPNLAFPPGQADCAMELLRGQVPPGGLLHHVRATPGFFTTYTEQGICGVCRQQSQQVNSAFGVNVYFSAKCPGLP